MKQHTSLILLAFFLYLCMGCRHSIDSRLLRAESLMQDNPDLSLNVLKSITDTFPTSEYNRNVYRVLLTEAKYKTGENECHDTMISKAARYFEPRISNPYRAKSNLYYGIILSNRHKYGEALSALTKASQTTSLLQDTILSPFIARAIGDVLSDIHNPIAATEYYQRALKGFVSLGLSKYVPGAYFDVCRIFLNQNKYDSALYFAQTTYDLAVDYKDQNSLILALQAKLQIFAERNEFTEAMETYEKLSHITQSPLSDNDYENIGLAYIGAGMIPEAKEIENILNQRNSPRKRLSWMLAAEEKQYERAFWAYKAFSENNFNIFSDWIDQREEGLLLKNLELERENIRLESDSHQVHVWILVLLLTSFILICIIISIYIRTLKYKQNHAIQTIINLQQDLAGKEEVISSIQESHKMVLSEKDEIIEDIRTSYQKDLSEKERIIEQIRASLRDSIKSEFRLIDKLAKEFYEIENDKLIENKKILKTVKQVVHNMKDSEYVKSNLYRIINTRLTGFLDNLKLDFPSLTDEDMALFTFSLLKFSGKSIGLFMGITDNAVYARKRLLRLKLEKNNPEKSILYTSWL